MKYCDSSRTKFKCSLRTGVPAITRSGEQVTINRPTIQSPFPLNFDLSTSPIKTDLYLLIDATGSMTSIPIIKRNFLSIANVFAADPDSAFGVGIYRDESELSGGFKNLQSISTSLDGARQALKIIGPTGGRDGPEANLVALYNIATSSDIAWRKDSRKLILMFGDQVGHEPTCYDDVKLNRSIVIPALVDKGITVVAVDTGTSLDDETSHFGCGNGTAPSGQTSAITKATGGKFVRSPGDAMVIQVAVRALSSLTKQLKIVANTCITHFSFTSRPKLPAVLPSDDATVDLLITPRKSLCSDDGFRCVITFGESGTLLQPVNLRFRDVRGC